MIYDDRLNIGNTTKKVDVFIKKKPKGLEANQIADRHNRVKTVCKAYRETFTFEAV